MNHFCTISTASHLYKVHALADSLRNQHPDFVMHVLVVDDNSNFFSENCRYWKLTDIGSSENAQAIINKYKNNNDKLRWSLKPVFLKYLLQREAIDQLIYLDNDLYFFSSYQFLFDLLGKHSFLLTPHYYKHDPGKDQNWLEANFRVGLFNAGFVGVNKNALNTLQWWADCCKYRCEKNSFRGLFDDQKYLDLVPVIEKDSLILRHKGCNVAGWNTELCQREIINHQIRIEKEFPIVFIHFNDTTIREIISGKDEILFNFYRDYLETLKKYKPELKEKELLFEQPWTVKIKFGLWKILTEYGI
ncbi:MAG: hypothetical protein V4615_09625 [Bacteroidota bacterium]